MPHLAPGRSALRPVDKFIENRKNGVVFNFGFSKNRKQVSESRFRFIENRK
jgi:hypothetical protein